MKINLFENIGSFKVFLSRRIGWIVENISLSKTLNICVLLTQYILKNRKLVAFPLTVKIDITSQCNLRCTLCVHATPNGVPILEKQKFNSSSKMGFEQYTKIIDEIKGKTSAVSLFWFGDPLMHPDIDEMCLYAYRANLNVHITTHFGFKLSEARIRSLALSGITHLTVAIDGMTQDIYEKTRVGGKLELVQSNLERLCAFKKRQRLKYPKIEAQYLKFQHNIHQLPEAKEWLNKIGVDTLTEYWGSLGACYVGYVGNSTFKVTDPKKKKLLPLCYWPYFFMIIKSNGDVVPCCGAHRVPAQFSIDERDEKRILGNVFKSGLRGVWNSKEYQQSRAMVRNPYVAAKDELGKQNFCNECPHLFETNAWDYLYCGSDYKYEDLYDIVDGIPVFRIKVE